MKWATLSEDLTAFVNDGAAGDVNGAVQYGKQAGQECAKIPTTAARAGGFTN
jgi:hypothetical protein